ncbi:MAG: DUF3783 domain-containing protein [Clostridia bacterium]|nr:DUF3783 domain-containing protein [Clostridia bacterium]
MNTPVLILFNFSPARAAAVASCARGCGFEVRPAANSEHRVPLSAILGPAPADALTRPAFTDEMLVFAASDRERVFAFLDRMKEDGVAPVALKAVLTPFNIRWTAEELYRELFREHRAMTREKAASPHG